MAAAATLGGLLLVALILGFHGNPISPSRRGEAQVPDEDSLAVTSSGRTVTGPGSKTVGGGVAIREMQAEKGASAQLQQMLAEQQRAAQQAAIADQQRQLQLQAAQQAVAQQALEQERQRVVAEKQQVDVVAAEAARLQAAAAAAAERLKQQPQSWPRPAYGGPSSGTIVWQGQVQGTTLVTIDGNSSDSGQVISGALPGVLVMVQPADTKHVGIAGTPAPSNGYRRLTLRIQGKGAMQEVIHWSIP
jgi:hypothetical protein